MALPGPLSGLGRVSARVGAARSVLPLCGLHSAKEELAGFGLGMDQPSIRLPVASNDTSAEDLPLIRRYGGARWWTG